MIKIVPDERHDVHVTEEELRRYTREYENFCKMHVSPPSLENYIRSQQQRG